MFVCGLLVEPHSSSVITADVKDLNFHAAIFGNDDNAMPDMTLRELQNARRYLIHAEGWFHRHHSHPRPGVVVLCPLEARG